MYIDQLLLSEVNKISLLPDKDFRTLSDLIRIINSTQYITQNQGSLIIKLLKKYNDIFLFNISDLDNPTWARPFRMINITKKLYIGLHQDRESILIETHNFKKHFGGLQKKITSLSLVSPNVASVELTEDNIVVLVEYFLKQDFDIDPIIKQYYDIITSWKVDDVLNQYQLSTIKYPTFQKQISKELGIDTPLDNNIIQDRSIRYQYYTKTNNTTFTSLTEKIAYRTQSKIWIDNSIYSLDDVIKSLVELRRLPVLVVFDTHNPKDCFSDLTVLSNALTSNNINNNISIYFRLSNNDPLGKEFNQLISELKYNSVLDTNTNVVGIQTTKLPKFMLTNNWRPMSVISIGHSLKHSKSAVYANCSDLIISYTNQEPIIESRAMWE